MRHELVQDRRLGALLTIAARGAPADEAGASFAVLALDIGATQLRAAAVDGTGHVLTRDAEPTLSRDGPESLVRRSIGLLERVRERVPAGVRRKLAGVGIASVGPLDPLGGRLIEPPNMGPAFRGLAICEPVERALRLPVALERDTNVAALAEQSFGAAQGVRDFVYITLSTGLGGAIVSRGELLRGADGMAGEIGHTLAELDGPECGCGARGHLEAVVSGTAIARAATAAAGEGRSQWLKTRLAERPLEARDVVEAEAAGDRAAAEIMERAIRAFAAAMIGVVNLFNPELIGIGGGIAEAQPERWLAAASEAVRADAFRVPAARVRIVQAALGRDVALLGAVPLLRARAPKLD